jgi:hypothetical protein
MVTGGLPACRVECAEVGKALQALQQVACLVCPPFPAPHRSMATRPSKGYALNKMCFSFNDEANRQAFVADEEAT